MPTKHGKCNTTEYNSWSGMINRCAHPSQKGFEYMQKAGIRVHDSWLTFEGFYADMGSKPDPDLVLTRLDPNGDFCASNCVWAKYGVSQHNDKLRSNNTSGVKGVFFTSRNKYQAAIYVDSNRMHLGTFDTVGGGCGCAQRSGKALLGSSTKATDLGVLSEFFVSCEC